MNDREYMQIQRNAEEAGLPMAQFMRELPLRSVSS
jgi:hypothetical protein